MKNTASATVSYFGKLPTRGDFVSTYDNREVMGRLDRWTASSLELLSQNPDWKQLYDSAPGIHYAFMAPHSPAVVCGCLLPSHDATRRRFPFLTALQIGVTDPSAFIRQSPLALKDTWAQLSRLGRQAVTAGDPGEALRELSASRYQIDTDPTAHTTVLHDYLSRHTLNSMERLLTASDHKSTAFRQMLPALGLLLQPILAGGPVIIDKGLELPLPREPQHRTLMASFWLDLISGFLTRSSMELAVLIQHEGVSRMVVGFNGADIRILHALFDPHIAMGYLIRIADSEWVEEELTSDYRLNKLASYLDRNDLTLSVGHQAFHQTFLGG